MQKKTSDDMADGSEVTGSPMKSRESVRKKILPELQRYITRSGRRGFLPEAGRDEL